MEELKWNLIVRETEIWNTLNKSVGITFSHTVTDFVAVMKLLFLHQEGISVIMCGHIICRLYFFFSVGSAFSLNSMTFLPCDLMKSILYCS
jgi:hypothetical protein